MTSASLASLVEVFARQAQNPHWQWYVDAHQPPGSDGDDRRPPPGGGIIGFIRAARYPTVEAKPPTDLPSSRVFRGVGQAFLNTNLLDARDNIEVLFKSSPFGTQSHGYDAQNSFQLYAYGQPLPTWWRPTDQAVPRLTGWAGGSHAAALVGKSREAIRDAAVRSLAFALHLRPDDVGAQVQACLFHDWNADPLARGAYTYVGVGGSDAYRTLAEPVGNTLFFAGEATCGGGRNATSRPSSR